MDRWRVVLRLVRWDQAKLDPVDLGAMGDLLHQEGGEPETTVEDATTVRVALTVEAGSPDDAEADAVELLRDCAYSARVRMPPFDIEVVEPAKRRGEG